MPGVPDFSVLAPQNLSFYDDTTGTITIMGSALPRHLSHQFQARHGLGNGYISAEISFYGPFFEEDRNQTHATGKVTHGWPVYNPRKSFASVGGFYDCHDPEDKIGVNYPELLERGCESIISGIPYFYGLGLEVQGRRLDSDVDEDEISQYVGALEMRNGLSKRSYVWSPKGVEAEFEIEYTMLASRTRPNVAATRLKVTPRRNVKGSVIDILDGRSAVRSKFVDKGLFSDDTIYVSNHPDGRPYLQAWTVSKVGISTADTASRREREFKEDESDMSIGQEWDIDFIDGETVTFTKFVGVADSQHFGNPEKAAHDAAGKAYTDGWDTILSEHVQAWNALMDNSLVPSYRDPSTGLLPENNTILNIFQASSTSDRFNLFQNLLPEDGTGLNDGGLSVGGIASEAYAGMVFWDMDYWMYPSIALTSPSYARQLINFRLRHFEQAKRNAQEGYVQDKYGFKEGAVLYSWTTGGFGNATGTGPVLDYEYHLNTDVALMMFQHRLITGDERLFREKLWPVVLGVGSAITTLLQKDGEGWSIKNMTDPDEFAVSHPFIFP
jgi:trehalose/maltose hydrolase-like predicted phosphorylase